MPGVVGFGVSLMSFIFFVKRQVVVFILVGGRPHSFSKFQTVKNCLRLQFKFCWLNWEVGEPSGFAINDSKIQKETCWNKPKPSPKKNRTKVDLEILFGKHLRKSQGTFPRKSNWKKSTKKSKKQKNHWFKFRVIVTTISLNEANSYIQKDIVQSSNTKRLNSEKIEDNFHSKNASIQKDTFWKANPARSYFEMLFCSLLLVCED